MYPTGFSRVWPTRLPLAAHALALTFVSLFLIIAAARANLPGNTIGTGTNVTLTTSGSAVTMSNGIVSITFGSSNTTMSAINYTANGVTTKFLGTNSGSELYWPWITAVETDPSNCTYTVVVDPATNGGNYAEVSMVDTWPGNLTTFPLAWDMDIRYAMFRGSSGFYCVAIGTHRNTYPATSLGQFGTILKLSPAANWFTDNTVKNQQCPPAGTSNIPVPGAPQEVSLWTSGIYNGTYECKYDYCTNWGDTPAWGWSNVTNSTAGVSGNNVGIWMANPTFEYDNGGPMHNEIMCAGGTYLTLINTPNGGHYGFGGDGNIAANEQWSKTFGPFFVYLNAVSKTITDPRQAANALYADAQAQAAAETSAWPYSWLVNGNYTLAAGRGNVTGHIAINDVDNPNASAAGLWVGVAQMQANTTTFDYQQWAKNYQFWAKTDANGNFTIPEVIAGSNYTLYAFGSGAAGTYQSQVLSSSFAVYQTDIPASPFSVTVTGGNTTALGNLTWTPKRVGPTVWEIGVPDHLAAEFRHGDDCWHGDIGPGNTTPSPIWAKFLLYPIEYPNGPTYTVGSSRWSTDWFFAQPAVTTSAGVINGSTSTIVFNLASAPASGAQASIYIAQSANFSGPLIVTVNNNNITSPTTGYFANNSSDAMIRMGEHGCFSDNRITFAGSLLHAGSNNITLNMRKGGNSGDSALYDYLRLELTGYVPPAPAGVAAYPGNNAVLLSWPAVPGATSYNILRSTTSGSGYTSLTANVTGPVCGSGPANSTYTDASAANGSTYFYVVQSVNPVGASGNSTQGATSPSSGSATTAPSTPTGFTATAGNTSVALAWTASSGASYYTVGRSVFTGGPYTTLSNTITGANYTDTYPANGTPYYYVVSATNAVGTSANSTEATATPLPTAPSAIPGNLTVTPGAAQNTLNWSAVPGAIGYVIARGTNPGGPFTLLASVTTLTYTNTALSNNTAYYYTVTAMNAAGASANSTAVVGNTAPAAPVITGLGGTGNVTLSWANVSGAANYTVQRSTTTGTEVTIASNITTNTYTDTGRTNGSTVFYVVDSVNSSGATSADSNEVAVTPMAIPTGLTVAGNTGNVVLSWGNVTSAGNYTVRRATISGGPYTTINSTVTVGNLTDVTVANGTPYFYVVAAANSTTDATSTTVSHSLSNNSTEVTVTPLAAPIGVTAVTSTGNATLSWGNVTGATSYAVRRGNITGGPYVTINSTITTSPYVDTGLTNGSSYFYVVAAQATSSLSSNSTQATAIPVAPPTGVSATGNTGNVTLGWTASLGATSYVVRRGTITGGPYTTVTSSATGTAYPDTTAVNGTTYFYVLAGLNSTGLSINSTEVFATPLAAPANLTANPGNGNVSLNWSAAAGASGYTIKRSTTSGSGYTNLATGVTVTAFKDSTAVNGTTYYYVVVSTNTNSGSNNSAEVNATPVAPPTAPTGLTATPGNTTVTLNWSSVSGAATYNVLRSTTSGSGYATVASALGNTTYADTGLTNGSTYYYVVSATNAGGTSPNSVEVSAIPTQSLAQWTASYFPGVSDPNVIGPSADPDGDGLSNLVEYLLGTNPTVPDSSGGAMSSAADGSGDLVLTFRLSKNLAGVTYTVQSSTDLVNWTDTGVTPTIQSDQGAYYIMQAVVPIGSNSKLLLRLNVTAN